MWQDPTRMSSLFISMSNSIELFKRLTRSLVGRSAEFLHFNPSPARPLFGYAPISQPAGCWLAEEERRGEGQGES